MENNFFVVNPKSYLFGEKLYQLAQFADNLAEKEKIKIFFTVPFVEIQKIKSLTNNIIITAQHMDDTNIGRGMGHIVGEMLLYSGVKAIILNHAEHKIEKTKLEKTIEKAKKLNFETIVCASDYEEVKYISNLNPDIILCEPTYLIGTGNTSSNEYINKTTKIIRDINPRIQVMQAAGVTSEDDVYKIMLLGVDGTGCTSGIVLDENPEKKLEKMVLSLKKAIKDRGIK